MEIPLRNRNKEVIAKTIIDADDYDRVSKYRWYLHINGYVAGVVNKEKILLHHFILGKPKDKMIIDHIDGNRLNNCKNNLRYTTYKHNAQNKIKKSNTSSKYIGVSKTRYSYQSRCCDNNLGLFKTELEAAITYDVYT
ncbi:MAG: hypothetical protein EBU66_20645, partial [Bacteroidetes bacterium]|nr:hypothetical protein [Bacteroidota bacterium]